MKIKKSLKKSISLILTILMIVSTLMVATTAVSAATLTSNGNIYLYFNGSPSSATNWAKDGDTVIKLNAYFYGSNGNAWSEQAVNVSGNYYAVNVPSGSWTNVILVRHNPTDSNIKTFDNNWGQTGDLSLSTTDNYISNFNYSSTTTSWGDYAAPAKSVNATMTGAGVLSGSGTSSSPYILEKGSTVTVNATSATNTLGDTNLKYKYAFNNTTYGTASSATVSTSTVSTSNQSYIVRAKSNYDTYDSSTVVSKTIYYKVQDSTPVEKTWYVTGRFGVKNEDGNSYTYTKDGIDIDNGGNGWQSGTTSDVKFTKTAENQYELNTGLTITELSRFTQGGEKGLTDNNQAWFFQISDGSTIYRPDDTSVNATGDLLLTVDKADTIFKTKNSGGSFYFGDTVESTKTVTLHIDSSTTPPKFYFTLEGEDPKEPGLHKIKDGTKINGSLSFTSNGNTADGTANSGDEVTINVKPDQYFTLESMTASYKDAEKVEHEVEITDNKTFIMPESEVAITVTVTAVFKLDKLAYIKAQSSGLYLDVAPEKNDTLATLIKWNNYTGTNHSTSGNPYTFYVPKNVDLSQATLYNANSTQLTINGVSIPANSSAIVSLADGGTYTTSGAVSRNVKVMQGSTASMFLYTTDGNGNAYNLPTATQVDPNAQTWPEKDSVKASGGACTTITDKDVVSDAMLLAQVKGRGNSSWEASMKLFGKYAYNMKLDSKTKLFGMDSAKSWCLLANNVDESMLRNALTNQLADDIGLYNSPEYTFVDIYDNGEYMGQYLVTEKVDVGSSKLVKGESIDDINEGALPKGEKINETTNTETYNYNGKNITIKYATVSSDPSFNPEYKKGTYLLEFEIKNRVDAEASYFKTPQGQYVVVKSPEFATKEEVKFIAEKFVDMENAVYASNSVSLATLSQHMDVDSFARMYLIQEISSNLDSAATSYFLTYACPDGDDARFVASPVWDYDWAYGQYQNATKEAVGGTKLDPTATNAWFAKNKKIGDNEVNQYNIQSKLCQNANFNSVVKKVWNGSDSAEGVYAKLQKFYVTDGKIDQWTAKITKSVEMNEYRWGFIKNDPSSGWGSKDTGSTHSAAVQYLKNWLNNRSSWLNTEINKYNNYTPITTPEITAYVEKDEEQFPEMVEEGTTVTIKVTTKPEAFVTYELYDETGKLVDTSSDGTFKVTPDKTHTYKVKAVYTYNGVTQSSDYSNEITVNVNVTVKHKVSVEIANIGQSTSLGTVMLTDSNGQNLSVTDGSSRILTADISDGADFTLTFKSARKYQVKMLQVKKGAETQYSDVTNGINGRLKDDCTYTVSNTDQDYYFYVTFGLIEELEKFEVTVQQPSNGTITVTYNNQVHTSGTFEVTEDDYVELSFVANDGYTLNYYTGDGKNLTSELDGNKFYPSGHITISAVFKKAGATLDKVEIWFKSTTLATYAVQGEFNGGKKTTLTRVDGADGYIGTYITGAYRFYWYKLEVENVVVGTNYPIRFTTAKSKLNASGTINFENVTEVDGKNIVYLGVDNLVNGTKIEDLSGNENARRSFCSVQNMFTNVTNTDDPGARVSVNVTKADGTTSVETYLFGDVDCNNTINVKDATKVQMYLAGLESDTENMSILGDYDINGDVNVQDATKIQLLIAKLSF